MSHITITTDERRGEERRGEERRGEERREEEKRDRRAEGVETKRKGEKSRWVEGDRERKRKRKQNRRTRNKFDLSSR